MDIPTNTSSQSNLVHGTLAPETQSEGPDVRVNKGLLTPGSCTGTRAHTPARRRSHLRASSTPFKYCLTRSPSIGQVYVRPSAPTPGSLLSRLSLRSPRFFSPNPSSSDASLTPPYGPPFQRPYAPTPGSALSQASPDSAFTVIYQ